MVRALFDLLFFFLAAYWWWMRNSAILDNNMGGVTMVSGGDPSGVVEGYWVGIPSRTPLT